MKKLLAMAFAGTLIAVAPAYAGSRTVEFTSADGKAQTWTFNDDGTAISTTGATATYTWDAEKSTLCAEIAGETPQKICMTMAEVSAEPVVGASTTYVTDAGAEGVAKIVAIES